MPAHLAPMLASPGRLPGAEEGWAFEVKWDGVRALLYWHSGHPGRVRIESRNCKEIDARYPELHALGRQLGKHDAVLDGEIVAFDERGLPSFERLQKRMHLTSKSAIARAARELPVTYAIFDLLYLDGRPTIELPYHQRRELLERLRLKGAAWQVPVQRVGGGAELLAATAEQGLEGVIAKRLDSPYRPGERSEEWVKIKNVHRQEFVIGGWLPGKEGRAGQLGALLVGYYQSGETLAFDRSGETLASGQSRETLAPHRRGETLAPDRSGETLASGQHSPSGQHPPVGQHDGGQGLRYAGRVGTGFDESELRRLAGELEARSRPSSPFAAHGVQPPREARFVEPELVAEIEFSRWTRDRILRHSSYKGLRTDKPPAAVTLEAAKGGVGQQAGGLTSGELPEGTNPRRGAGARAKVGPTEAQSPYEIVHTTKRHVEIEVQGRRLRLSNRDKVLYPEAGFTKGELIDYYTAVAPSLLPHLVGRPVTLKRYPDGVNEPYFYEKRCPTHRPEWVQTAPVWSGRQAGTIDYCLIEDLPTLIWVANLAAIELHPGLARAHALQTPTTLVFDLDPGEPAGVRECCHAALSIREIFDAFGLQSVVKTSGAKGLQVYVPLNIATTYEQTKPFARAVAELLEKQHPKLIVSRMTKSLRAGRVLIDWSQNDPHKTTVSVYSLRANATPLISTPLHWEEVELGARRRRGRERALSVVPRELLRRVERDGDLFAAVLGVTQSLPDLDRGVGSGARKDERSAQREATPAALARPRSSLSQSTSVS
jgi:bifunctional non-homologous end joining protein LigD